MAKIHYHAIIHIVRDIDTPFLTESETLDLDKKMLKEEISKIFTGHIIVSGFNPDMET